MASSKPTNRFGGRVLRKKKKAKEKELKGVLRADEVRQLKASREKEISERLARQQAMRLARQKSAIERRRNVAAEVVPQVLADQANQNAVAPPVAAPVVDSPVAVPAVDALVPRGDPQLPGNVAVEAGPPPGDPALGPNAAWGEQLPPPPEAQAAGDVAALARQQASETQQASPTDQLNQFSKDYLGKVSMRKKIMQSLTAAFGGTSIADDYEKEALAKYTNYVNNQAGKIALAGGNVDAAMGITRFLDAGGDLDQALELFGKPGAATKSPTQRTIYDATHKIGQQWTGSSWQETYRTPITSTDTNIDFKFNAGKGQEEADKDFNKYLMETLTDSGENPYMAFETQNAQIPMLVDALATGKVMTGAGAKQILGFQQAMAHWLPDDLVGDLMRKDVASKEWFDAISSAFVGDKLKMTKGSISEREMKIFMDMIPRLSGSREGNIRLFNTMYAMNNIALSKKVGAGKFADWLSEKGGLAAVKPLAKARKLKEFQDKERDRAVRFFNYVESQPVGATPIPLTRIAAYTQLREANKPEVTDKQINDLLDKWGYPSG